MIIDRLKFFNALKRVSVFSNQASNLIKLQIAGNQVTISAQDIDFSISAYERIPCQYEGEELEIGFKSTFLIEILQNLQSSDIVTELSDPSRAGILLPLDKENENEDVLMLLMPMMINN
jgi:DNA polymerase-3 subunit beta